MHVNMHLRSGRSGKTKWRQAHVSKPVCLLTRRKALQQSISDYKHAAPAYASTWRKDRRKSRAKGGQSGKGWDRESEVAGVGSSSPMLSGSGSNEADVHVRHTQVDLLRSRTRPNTVWSRSSVLQFQRWCLNWCWHSLIHSLVPSPMACMMSGWRWQSCRCLFTKPGMLSQITRAPSAPMYLRMQKIHKEVPAGFDLSQHQHYPNWTRAMGSILHIWVPSHSRCADVWPHTQRWQVAWRRAAVTVLHESEFTTLNSLRFARRRGVETIYSALQINKHLTSQHKTCVCMCV